MSPPPRVGFVPPFDALVASHAERRALAQTAVAAGVDHLGTTDHLSFHDGRGYDGLVHAASLLALDPAVHVVVGLYLLPLRHPFPVARQVATVAELAPGRLTFAVGIGGEDRREVENCGIDPTVRGRRMDECLQVLRDLLTGEAVTFVGDHVAVRDAVIRPAPDPPVPVLVGGRSAAAHRRAGRLGDGWLGIWVSAERYGRVLQDIAGHAAAAGRPAPTDHALTAWVGFGDDAAEGRRHLAPAMEDTYRLPFETFARWSPCGPPADVAAFLAPYAAAGCRTFNLMPRAGSPAETVAAVAEVRARLTGG